MQIQTSNVCPNSNGHCCTTSASAVSASAFSRASFSFFKRSLSSMVRVASREVTTAAASHKRNRIVTACLVPDEAHSDAMRVGKYNITEAGQTYNYDQVTDSARELCRLLNQQMHTQSAPPSCAAVLCSADNLGHHTNMNLLPELITTSSQYLLDQNKV